MSERKLLVRYISVPNKVDLEWLKKNMENRIDAHLILEDYIIEYKSYETEFEYETRIKREALERDNKNNPEYIRYMELKQRFEPWLIK